mmetsp:Transcript_1070/g.2312  ORF Transcript_1070/g.2312 Transcript_1070/m.2312 type:complete len:217 (-) Transcript_1070:71-721(-)
MSISSICLARSPVRPVHSHRPGRPLRSGSGSDAAAASARRVGHEGRHARWWRRGRVQQQSTRWVVGGRHPPQLVGQDGLNDSEAADGCVRRGARHRDGSCAVAAQVERDHHEGYHREQRGHEADGHRDDAAREHHDGGQRGHQVADGGANARAGEDKREELTTNEAEAESQGEREHLGQRREEEGRARVVRHPLLEIAVDGRRVARQDILLDRHAA